MRLTFTRKAAIALAAVAGSVGLSVAAPVAAHAEEPAPALQTAQDPSLSQNLTADGAAEDSSLSERKIVGSIAVDLGGGCTQFYVVYSDGRVLTFIRCVVVIQG